MKSKRILSIILVFVMVFAMAAAGCGKKEEPAEKEEPKQEETSDTDEAEVDDEDDAEAAEEETANKEKKTGDDILTEEDIQSLKESIRDAVISEYLEPNNIAVEDLTWPDEASGEWGYMVELVQEYHLSFAYGTEMDVSKVDSSRYSNPKLIEAAFNGITYWLDKQGECDSKYVGNVFSAMFPYDEIIPTIDFGAK